MTDKQDACPLCNRVVTYYGEGGYGKCANNKCTFELKTKGCDLKPCTDTDLKETDHYHTAND